MEDLAYVRDPSPSGDETHEEDTHKQCFHDLGIVISLRLIACFDLPHMFNEINMQQIAILTKLSNRLRDHSEIASSSPERHLADIAIMK